MEIVRSARKRVMADLWAKRRERDMESMEWQEAFEIISPYVVKISSPQGMGTGFLIAYSNNKEVCGIATAAHVVGHANQWESPIRVQNFRSNASVLLNEEKRAIFVDESMDTAVIISLSKYFDFPDAPMGLSPDGMHVPIGKEVCWTGYPALAPLALCLFAGRISCWLEEESAYLADGVAINGVSGGPAFHALPEGKVEIVGVVSAYIPNRATGEVLPGLCVLRDVKQLQKIVKHLSSFEGAKEEEKKTSSGRKHAKG
jgi:hypothetical protein